MTPRDHCKAITLRSGKEVKPFRQKEEKGKEVEVETEIEVEVEKEEPKGVPKPKGISFLDTHPSSPHCCHFLKDSRKRSLIVGFLSF